MAKTKVVMRKTTSKKRSTYGSYKRSGTVGGSSTKNYAVKYRNLDYKYRLVDLDDTFSSAVYSSIISTDLTAVTSQYGATGATTMAAGLATNCYFIPLTTASGVCRNMSVNIKCKYPFAYCVF